MIPCMKKNVKLPRSPFRQHSFRLGSLITRLGRKKVAIELIPIQIPSGILMQGGFQHPHPLNRVG